MDGGWGKRDMGWKTLLVALPGEEKSWYMSIVHCPDCMNLELVQLVHLISGASLVIGHKLAGEEENIGRPLPDYKSTHSRLYHIRCTPHWVHTSSVRALHTSHCAHTDHDCHLLPFPLLWASSALPCENARITVRVVKSLALKWKVLVILRNRSWQMENCFFWEVMGQLEMVTECDCVKNCITCCLPTLSLLYQLYHSCTHFITLVCPLYHSSTHQIHFTQQWSVCPESPLSLWELGT